MKNKTTWINRFNFATLCAWLIASIYMATTALLWFGQDFRGYYAAARVLLTGGNPYDYNQLAPVLLAVTGRMGNNPYYYPPWFAWFFTPLAGLPFEIARGVWMLFNWILWTLSLWQLSKLLNWPKTGWRRWLTYLLATFVFAWLTWRYEQVGILLFALLVGALSALRNQRWLWAGICLALLLIKVNITLIPLLAISLWLVRHKKWQPLLVMAGLTVALLVAATIATPIWYKPLLELGFGQGLVEVLDGPDTVVAMRLNTTLKDWLMMLQVSPEISSAIHILAALLGLVALALVIWRSESLIQVTAVSLLVTAAVTPYALQYDYPPLAITLFWATALYSQATSKITRVGGSLISLFIASVPYWERPISDGYWIVIGLLALYIWNYFNRDKLQVPENWSRTTQELF